MPSLALSRGAIAERGPAARPRRAYMHAGHTILFSALTVAASMATLMVFPLQFLRSMGYGGIVASLLAMLTALIVLATVLRLLGPCSDACSARA
jgi:uncharacterized membrane protein YdfJ with MMPL/SSD domain